MGLQDCIDEGNIPAVLSYIDFICSRKFRYIGAFCSIIDGAIVKFNKYIDNIPQRTLDLLAAMGYYKMPIKRGTVIRLAADIMADSPSRPKSKQFILITLFAAHKIVELFNEYCIYFRIADRNLQKILHEENTSTDRAFYFTSLSEHKTKDAKFHLKNSPVIYYYNLEKFGWCYHHDITVSWFTYILGWCVAVSGDILYDISIVSNYEPLLSIRVISLPGLEIIGQVAHYSRYIDEQSLNYENANNLLETYIVDKILYIIILDLTLMVDIDTMDVVGEKMFMHHPSGANKLIPLINSFYYSNLNDSYNLLTYKSDDAWPPSANVKKILPFYNVKLICKIDQLTDPMDEIACQIENLDLQ